MEAGRTPGRASRSRSNRGHWVNSPSLKCQKVKGFRGSLILNLGLSRRQHKEVRILGLGEYVTFHEIDLLSE